MKKEKVTLEKIYFFLLVFASVVCSSVATIIAFIILTVMIKFTAMFILAFIVCGFYFVWALILLFDARKFGKEKK